MLDELSRLLSRRTAPLIDLDTAAGFGRVAEKVADSRVLVIGGAGSIGRAVVEALCKFSPRALHVTDIDENGLADLVRDLRSGSIEVPNAFRTSVIDFGTSGFRRFVKECGFDVVLNLAAMKHVRSERDAYTLHRMLDTNVRAVADLYDLALDEGVGRVFSVSSDKAVRPENLMGASKRWMEKIVCRAGGTTARFANVAFSKGSLPRAMLQRLERGEPISAPSDVSRYFITHAEAANLCLLAAFDAADGAIVVPDLAVDAHALSMVEVATIILAAHGLTPRPTGDAAEAKRLAAERPREAAWWPCLFEPSDTGGEKDLEELFYPDEACDSERYTSLRVVRTTRIADVDLDVAMNLFREAEAADVWDKASFVLALRCAVPELRHSGVQASLDERM